MKFTFKTTAILMISLALSGRALASQTDIESRSQTILPEASQISQATPEFDTLIRAVRQFLIRDRYSIESKMTMLAQFPGGEVSFSSQIKTTTATPNRFRSEIAFTNSDGRVGNQYVVVSNGKQVWIHDLNANIYSVMDYQSFHDYDDGFMIGFFSSIFLTIREGEENVDTLLDLPEDQLVEAVANQLEVEIDTLNSGTENFEGTQYETYRYNDPEQEFVMTAFIEPTTAAIAHFQIAGQEDNLDIVMRESIVDITELRFIPANTFRFLPPFNAQKVDTTISIEPF